MSEHPTSVIKRRGERATEHYDHAKLHSSVRAACLSVRSPEGEAETIADRVAEVVSSWIHTKPSVTSDDLRRVAVQNLEKLHPEAAYLYQTHELVV